MRHRSARSATTRPRSSFRTVASSGMRATDTQPGNPPTRTRWLTRSLWPAPTIGRGRDDHLAARRGALEEPRRQVRGLVCRTAGGLRPLGGTAAHDDAAVLPYGEGQDQDCTLTPG